MPADVDLVVSSSLERTDIAPQHDDSAPWDEVALVLENDSPITTAVAKAIAETPVVAGEVYTPTGTQSVILWSFL